MIRSLFYGGIIVTYCRHTLTVNTVSVNPTAVTFWYGVGLIPLCSFRG
jgi:hypothetical protein